MSPDLLTATAETPDRLGLVTMLGPRAAALASPDGVCIVSGQQPALGLGPLYSLLKAAHAVALARGLNAAGRPCVPIFWCASDDHDLGEAGHADLIGADGRLQRCHAPFPRRGAALHRQPADCGWSGLRAALGELGPGPGQAWIDAHAPRSDEGLGVWMQRVFSALFPDLVVVEAKTLRPRFETCLARALAAWPAAALRERGEELTRLGRDDGLGELAEPPLFDDREDGRYALNTATARAVLGSAPERLSPGAALRPACQQAALPCIAYVAGPGEIRYHARLPAVFAACGVAMPRLIPRCSRTLVDAGTERALAAHGLDAATWLAQGCPLPKATASADDPAVSALDAVLVSFSDGQDAERQRRLSAASQRLQRERQRLARSLARLEAHRHQRPALGPIAQRLRPRGLAQERVLSTVQALWHWGPGLAEQLVSEASQNPSHQIWVG